MSHIHTSQPCQIIIYSEISHSSDRIDTLPHTICTCLYYLLSYSCGLCQWGNFDSMCIYNIKRQLGAIFKYYYCTHFIGGKED